MTQTTQQTPPAAPEAAQQATPSAKHLISIAATAAVAAVLTEGLKVEDDEAELVLTGIRALFRRLFHHSA